MPRHICLVTTLIWLSFASCPHPLGARGSDAILASDLCVEAAEKASQQSAAPLKVLLAVTLTETGRDQEGDFRPWPWTLNVDGKGQWFATKEQALAGLSEAIAQGASSIDIGCFQVNLQWHGANFASAEQMMDPAANADYAADLLSRHAAEQGDWILAAGAYHSLTPDKAETYLARFKPIYANLSTAALDENRSRLHIVEPRNNGFPLLIRGSNGAPGSIVPRYKPGRVLFGGG